MNRIVITAAIRATIAAGAFIGATVPVLADEYWDQKTSLFSILPIQSNDIVFVGNSITDGGEFSELFGIPNIKNRGIRSDVITGVEKRISQVTSGHPAKIFLLIGINDISHGLTTAKLAERYERLVKRIREESPETKVYLQSIMPINNDFGRYRNLKGKENAVRALNVEIERIAKEQGAKFIDLWPYLAGADGKLKKQFTNDGLHLNGQGYRAWTNGIRNDVKE
ncbi:MAG: hypothetical protein K2M37_04830 [Muribaculaceae bacterium]|nr:hypothetical protein [Muribaculaceae bacterium]